MSTKTESVETLQRRPDTTLFPILKVGTAPCTEFLKVLFDRNRFDAQPDSKPLRDQIKQTFGEALTPDQVVTKIINQVKDGGDKALFELSRQIDNYNLTARNMRVSERDLEHADNHLATDLKIALQTAARNIRGFQERLLPNDLPLDGTGGMRTGLKFIPLDRVGIYVPGGRGAYPSSVLMNAIPAIVAGVREVCICTPPEAGGSINPAVLYACRLAGVREVYRIGGAQAVAAMAFGTKTIRSVDMVVGPGNIFVQLAKLKVFGHCQIDQIAGPSELVVLADEYADAAYIAADLLAQAEHDPLCATLLVTDSAPLAEAVSAVILRQLELLPRREVVRQSLVSYGRALITRNIEEAEALVNKIAPEHVEVHTKEPNKSLLKITNAGAVFLGHSTPEVLGDYICGPSHTLPTGGTARFSSGLSCLTFLKRMSVIETTDSALRALSAATMVMAQAEGLEAHRRAIEVRIQDS